MPSLRRQKGETGFLTVVGGGAAPRLQVAQSSLLFWENRLWTEPPPGLLWGTRAGGRCWADGPFGRERAPRARLQPHRFFRGSAPRTCRTAVLSSDCTETGERKPPSQAVAGGGLTGPPLPPRPPGVRAPNPVLSAYAPRPAWPSLVPRGQSRSLPFPDLGPPQPQSALGQGPARSHCARPRPAPLMPPAQRPHPLVPERRQPWPVVAPAACGLSSSLCWLRTAPAPSPSPAWR